jgi:plasmid stability protein
MPTLVIKDVPVELHRRLKKEAQKAHRSMNGEAIHLLEAALSANPIVSAAHELPKVYEGMKLENPLYVDPGYKPRTGWYKSFELMAEWGDDTLLDRGGPETVWSRKEWQW